MNVKADHFPRKEERWGMLWVNLGSLAPCLSKYSLKITNVSSQTEKIQQRSFRWTFEVQTIAPVNRGMAWPESAARHPHMLSALERANPMN